MAHSAEAGPSSAAAPEWLAKLNATITRTLGVPGQLVVHHNTEPVRWGHWTSLPRLHKAFVVQGKQPGGALCPLDASHPPPTAAELISDPHPHFGVLLHRLARILDPRLTQEAAKRNVYGADIFLHGPTWQTVQGHMLPCMTIHHAALCKKIRPRKATLEKRRLRLVPASQQQRRDHHHCCYAKTGKAAGMKGKYLWVNLGKGCYESAHSILCALYSPHPRPSDARDAQGRVINRKTQHQVSHTCHNSLCLRPQHLRWATPQQNAAQQLDFGSVRLPVADYGS